MKMRKIIETFLSKLSLDKPEILETTDRSQESNDKSITNNILSRREFFKKSALFAVALSTLPACLEVEEGLFDQNFDINSQGSPFFNKEKLKPQEISGKFALETFKTFLEKIGFPAEYSEFIKAEIKNNKLKLSLLKDQEIDVLLKDNEKYDRELFNVHDGSVIESIAFPQVGETWSIYYSNYDDNFDGIIRDKVGVAVNIENTYHELTIEGTPYKLDIHENIHEEDYILKTHWEIYGSGLVTEKKHIILKEETEGAKAEFPTKYWDLETQEEIFLDVGVENFIKFLEYWKDIEDPIFEGVDVSDITELEQLVEIISFFVKNPSGYANFLKNVAEYQVDRSSEQEYKHPIQTLRDGWGDCDDYTILNCFWGALHGFKVDQILVPSHTFTHIIDDQGSSIIMDNTNVFEGISIDDYLDQEYPGEEAEIREVSPSRY